MATRRTDREKTCASLAARCDLATDRVVHVVWWLGFVVVLKTFLKSLVVYVLRLSSPFFLICCLQHDTGLNHCVSLGVRGMFWGEASRGLMLLRPLYKLWVPHMYARKMRSIRVLATSSVLTFT